MSRVGGRPATGRDLGPVRTRSVSASGGARSSSTDVAQEQKAGEALLDSAVRIPPHVVYRTFALETVVVNLEKGQYHGLNPTAGRMLEVLERSPTVREAAARLATEYGQPAEAMEADLCAFCSDLLERGLIELRP